MSCCGQWFPSYFKDFPELVVAGEGVFSNLKVHQIIIGGVTEQPFLVS